MLRFLLHYRRPFIRFDESSLQAISDLFINLSAGWYGAATIGVSLYDFTSFSAVLSLSTNLVFGTLVLAFGIKIRKLVFSSAHV